MYKQPEIIEPDHGDGDIPEIDLPKEDNAVNPIPLEMPGRRQSGEKRTNA